MLLAYDEIRMAWSEIRPAITKTATWIRDPQPTGSGVRLFYVYADNTDPMYQKGD